MNAVYPLIGDDGLRRILTARCGLSSQHLDLIAGVMRGSGVGFEEAALRLGLITPEDIRGALEADTEVEEASTRPARQTAVRSEPVGPSVKPTAGLAGLIDRFSARSEQMLALRTQLLLTRVEPPGRAYTIAVISAHGGEGRSRLAAELAISFAQLGDRTLLVDADMRRPTQHQWFEGANRTLGLAQAITAGTQPTVQPVESLPALSLLAAGAAPRNPLDLLSGRPFEDLMSSWRRQFSFVVLDTPPVSDCADALAVAHAASRVLVVCRANETRYEDAKAMLRRLATTQATVVGAVINHF